MGERDRIQSPKKVQVTRWNSGRREGVLEELRHGAQGKVEGTVPSTGLGAQEGTHPTITGPGVERDQTCLLHSPTNRRSCLGLISSTDRDLSTSSGKLCGFIRAKYDSPHLLETEVNENCGFNA